jgi:hypothetical protein
MKHYLTGENVARAYQLMKEDFPAEWLPINIMVIFLRGANNLKPRLSAMLT